MESAVVLSRVNIRNALRETAWASYGGFHSPTSPCLNLLAQSVWIDHVISLMFGIIIWAPHARFIKQF
ncbi:hypothetical protein BS47DRAFT_597235 [Hydnum rufescens UP504]|uniref:Uncharacterized protein n=1 Tax=Hydnum rufescens UP504 TaxID=1448309 RepID=A0A9P6DNB5_9AGAM|nr:hypothetical protein BS47DRAFT_597235 [Hydnum rufescens UP504]